MRVEAATISCKSRSTYQAVDAATQKYSQHFEELVNNKAAMVTTKAKSASQATIGTVTGPSVTMPVHTSLSSRGSRLELLEFFSIALKRVHLTCQQRVLIQDPSLPYPFLIHLGSHAADFPISLSKQKSERYV